MTIAPVSPDSLARAVDLLRDGRLVAVPTETVYGLAADATSGTAVARIFEAKGRPSFNPLIIHVTDLEMARRYAVLPALATKLAAAFWPGPLTLVLPRREGSGLSELVSAGLDTVAIRCPGAPVAQEILARLARPFAAPSANRSGSISPTLATHVKASLGDKVDLILDDGPCRVGVESTIVSIAPQGATLLRPGSITVPELESVCGALTSPQPGGQVQAPGMLASHYAPGAAVHLGITTPDPAHGFLGFGPVTGDGPLARNLSPAGDLREAAANLFRYLHELDALTGRIDVAPIPDQGLGQAINDRLNRAAAPRD